MAVVEVGNSYRYFSVQGEIPRGTVAFSVAESIGRQIKQGFYQFGVEAIKEELHFVGLYMIKVGRTGLVVAQFKPGIFGCQVIDREGSLIPIERRNKFIRELCLPTGFTQTQVEDLDHQPLDQLKPPRLDFEVFRTLQGR